MTSPTLVHHFLERSADRLPDKACLVCEGQRLTYKELEDRANRVANGLAANGVRRGDRVALFLPNSLDLVTGIFAVLKAGGVFVVVNPTTKRDKLAYILNNCEAAALITGPGQAGLAAQIQAEVPSLRFVVVTTLPADPLPSGEQMVLSYASFLDGCPASRPQVPVIDLDLACLIYTSGSTGDPKGVMSDHSNMVFAAQSIISYLENTQDDIVLDVLPLSFDYGLYQVLMTFCFGGTLVLEQGFTFPAAALRKIEQERVTGFPGVPTIFSIVLNQDLTRYDLSSLRYLTNTAAALPPAHILRLKDKFPQAKIFSMYGLTETKRTLYLPPHLLEQHPDSVGIAIPGTEVWIEDENGRRLGAGQTGELVVRGRHVMRGYWRAPEATARRYRPGPVPGERLCYTDDLFRMDENGLFYFVGRKDDIIKSRGEKVAPKEIENVVYQLEGVREVAAVGVPDPVLGQAVKLFIVRSNTAVSEADVLRHCRARLEDFMVPRYVEFCDELPKTTTGKISKKDL